MRTLFALLLAFSFSMIPLAASADNDSGLADVARVSWKKDVVGLDKKINMLDKRIAEGVKSGTLSADQAKELTAEVQALRDKKKEMMDANGAKVLTDDQLAALRLMLKDTAKKIYQAKHPKASSGTTSTP